MVVPGWGVCLVWLHRVGAYDGYGETWLGRILETEMEKNIFDSSTLEHYTGK